MNQLGLFAKWPRPGCVKTRLATTLGSQFATRVAEAFLRDSLVRLDGIANRQVVVVAPDDDLDLFRELTQGRWELEPQGQGSLGERLQRFFSRSFARNDCVTVAVGVDSPTLPLEYLRRAFDLLQTHDVVLGPAADGGYYLVGLSQDRSEIFQGITWGGPAVLRQTVGQLGDARLAILPVWYDVDTPDDWRMLQGHLLALRCARVAIDCPHTAALAGVSPS